MSIVRSYIAGTKLRRWLTRVDAPVWIRECRVFFDKAFGSRFKDPSPLVPSAVPRQGAHETPLDLRQLVPSSQVALHAYATYANVTYARSSTHLGSSLVLYHPAGSVAADPVPGSIKYIYSTNQQEVRLAIQRQVHAPPSIPDPFARYPHFPARIYSTSLSDHLEEVKLTWLVGHYGRWVITDEYCVVLALLRVCFLLYSEAFLILLFCRIDSDTSSILNRCDRAVCLVVRACSGQRVSIEFTV